jgi:hypothetical protein
MKSYAGEQKTLGEHHKPHQYKKMMATTLINKNV